jgi:hypothetical protein
VERKETRNDIKILKCFLAFLRRFCHSQISNILLITKLSHPLRCGWITSWSVSTGLQLVSTFVKSQVELLLIFVIFWSWSTILRLFHIQKFTAVSKDLVTSICNGETTQKTANSTLTAVITSKFRTSFHYWTCLFSCCMYISQQTYVFYLYFYRSESTDPLWEVHDDAWNYFICFVQGSHFMLAWQNWVPLLFCHVWQFGSLKCWMTSLFGVAQSV